MSSLAKPSAAVNADTAPCAYANSAKGQPAKPLGQLLHTHSIGVSRYANTVVQELLNLRQDLPGIGTEEIPSPLKKPSPDAAFDWQDKAVKLIKTDRGGVHEHAFFGVILSGTGSGKTIGALKMVAAFKQDMRVMYASPLRSLTLQSGTAFDKLGFAKDEIATIIGDALIKKIFYKTLKDEKNPEDDEPTALEACDESDEGRMLFSGGLSHKELKERIYSLRCIDDRAMQMIATPVLAATLDTVMKLSDARRGGYLSHFLRIATSDLIIDEADMYSPVDQLAIGRLIESCGFWRNRIFLSSATLSPITTQGFFAMYQKGLASRFALDGVKVPLSAGWFYNAIDPVIKRDITSDTFFDQHMHYVHAIAKTLADTPPKRVVRKFITRPSGLKDVDAKRLMQYTRDLHSVTKIETKDGRSFSFGCVQVVNVKSCQKMAIELCAIHADQRIAHPDFDYRVICLHGRLSHASRNYIEQRLNLMLSRGGKDGD